MSRKRNARASKAYEQKLIEEVKKRPFIYRKQHPDHKNALTASNAWKKIFEDLGENELTSSGSDCADLWSSLWSQYLGFKRKVNGSTGKAGGKRPSFRHEGAMREFDDKEYEESTISNITDENNNEEISEVQAAETHVTISNDGEIIVTSDAPFREDSASASTSFKSRVHEKAEQFF